MEKKSNTKCMNKTNRELHLTSERKHRSNRLTSGDNVSRSMKRGRPRFLMQQKLTRMVPQYQSVGKGTWTKPMIRKDRRMASIMNLDRRKQLRIDYKTCLGRKECILHEKTSATGNVLELIDRFRAVLDAMLGDENGFYPIDEILDVSRELDDMISFYYRTSGADFLSGYMPEIDYA